MTTLAWQTTARTSGCPREFRENLQRRVDAGFLQANISRAVRAATAARNRPVRKEYAVGERVYYWRRAKDDSILRKCYWRGPTFVSHQEPSTDPEKSSACVVWLVHGTVLLRTLPELIRPEYPAERSDRESIELGKPTTTTTADELLTRLRETRGPVHFENLTEEPWPNEAECYEEPVFGEEGTSQAREAQEPRQTTTHQTTRNELKSRPTPTTVDPTSTATPTEVQEKRRTNQPTEVTETSTQATDPRTRVTTTTREARSATPLRWF